ncbi:MAG: hypothetical protein FWE77_02545 [Clostridia bacterium]|nr:hypothetical protein [Clostridia bacterium]
MSEARQEPERIRGANWTDGALKQAGKILLYMLLLGLLSLMVAPILMLESPLLRVPLNLALFAGVALLVYHDGGIRGQKEVAHAHTMARRRESGVALSGEDLRACYHPMRGILPAALAALPFFALAAVLAALAEPHTYRLQSLPSWLSPYLRREDIGGPLQYYSQAQPAEIADYLRIAVRLVIMPFSYIAGGFGEQASLLLDRLSPLLVLIIPGAYAAGYLRGPALHKTAQKRSEEAKRRHKKKVARKKRRERQARAGRKPERLI